MILALVVCCVLLAPAGEAIMALHHHCRHVRRLTWSPRPWRRESDMIASDHDFEARVRNRAGCRIHGPMAHQYCKAWARRL
ncbi:hypothetical protein LX36DRAFT_310896 [Colletotrichum falcatum]|nr:hypothetical protein LX36DRAFT_310896 [Colletotrichum falcatum]